MAVLVKNYFSRIGKCIFSLTLLLSFSISSHAQVTHQVTVQNFSFSPANLVINQGDIVEWVNVSGFHNVNGTTASFPGNTNNFGNGPASSPWTYAYTFNNPGSNNYQCDIHPMMQGTVTVNTPFDCPELNLNIGDACNDNDPETESDAVNSECECVGTSIYDCPDLQLNIGDACNDNDPNTENDVVNTICECVGISIYDCPDLQLNIGDACNDGNPNTADDIVNVDCECIGNSIIPPNDECVNAIPLECGTTVFGSTNNSNLDGTTCSGSIDGPGIWYTISVDVISAISLQTCLDGTDFDTDLSVYTGECGDLSCYIGFSGDGYTDGTSPFLPDCPPTPEELKFRAGGVITALGGVTYYILLNGKDITETGNFELQVDCEVLNFDCPDLLANFYDSCDDGDIETWDDQINEDCECVGGEFDPCKGQFLNVGDLCDDGDPNTENDIVNLDCICVGDLIYCTDLDANAGDICDDGDETTINDVVSPDCNCIGTSIFDCPELQQNIGDSCDDLNPDTENDLVNAECECEGTVIYECEELQLNVGDSCQTDLTIEHIAEVNEGCECIITNIYCETFEGWSGEVCDDMNPNTENDVVTLECVCEGTLIFCPELGAYAGETCDDGDESTENDTINPECNCTGTSIYDCPELQLNFGDPCNDENPDTANDVIQEDCSCLGVIIPPENDEPCDAISLSCGQTLNTSSNFGTQSMESINCIGETTEPVSDVWFSTTMTDNAYNYLVETTGIDAVIGLYSSGCSAPEYEFCGSQSLSIPAENTGDFLIRIYDIAGSGNFSVSLSCQPVGVKEIHEDPRVMQLYGENIRLLRPEKVNTVIIYDLVGKRVQENSGTQEFSLTGSLNTGIYLAVAYDDWGAAIQSIKIFKR